MRSADLHRDLASLVDRLSRADLLRMQTSSDHASGLGDDAG
jgi:hypothetical protein